MVEQRRSYTPEEKLKIVLEGLSGTIQISDLCKKYGIKSARYYYCKEELINASNDIFGQNSYLRYRDRGYDCRDHTGKPVT